MPRSSWSAKPVGQRQDVIGQRGDDRLRTFLGHHFVKAVKRFVVHAAAVLEALDNLVFDAAQHGQPLHRGGEVHRHRSARQQRRMLGRQLVRSIRRIVVHDAAGDHRAEPFANVALVETGLLGNLRPTSRRQLGHHIEQAGAMADADHQAQRAAVEDANQSIGKRRDFRFLRWIEDICGHVSSPVHVK